MVLSDEAAGEYAAARKAAQDEKAKRVEEETRRRAKLSNAFAFSADDDDDDREQERMQAAKQAAQAWKTEMQSRVRPATQASTKPRIDMYTALKMIADFKRSCNGKAKQMPPEIVEATAMVTGMS